MGKRWGSAVGRAYHKPGVMNAMELEYAMHLELEKQVGTISRVDYEPEKLRLAKKTFYTPDFRVVRADGVIEFHEVKGHWEDDARVKIKCAAEMHPYKFIAVKKRAKKNGGGWDFEVIA